MIRDNSKDEVEIIRGYYDSGALRYETPYVNGKIHGIEKFYYESGVLSQEIPCENGENHGLVKGYYSSGALMWETPYVNGKIHGIEKDYEEDNSSIDRLTLYNKDRILLSLRCESLLNMYNWMLFTVMSDLRRK